VVAETGGAPLVGAGLNNHVAVVTGGARGIGAAICRALAHEGAHVVVWDRDDAALSLAGEIGATAGRASAVVADVTQRAQVDDAINEIIRAHSRIDILINCAGFSRDAPIADMTDEDWHAVIDVCLHGTFYVTRAVVPHMTAHHYGRIISISSRARNGDTNKVNYCAAKAAIDGFTYALALELGKQGITANAIAPGYCETDRVLRNQFAAEIRSRASEKTYTDRLGTPEDIAHTVLYLANPQAGFISGEVITVSGGRWR
jgi:3-oxoacyl-[acyl-carrier protein] reductase